ncbi:MAG TPA: BON domain-containing protein [Candidatus Dormibacteraeota bacterium]|jgi:hypothetical protein|nr:BON domain-containing protein [Candidatus Dormibacteraeota bacterium]
MRTRELRDIAKDIDISELRSRVRPFAEAAVQAAKSARETVRERAPSRDEVLKGLGLERRRSIWRDLFSWPLILGAMAGAAIMYLLDVEQGRRRRALVRDRAIGLANDLSRMATRTTRLAGSTAQGMTQRVAGVASSSPAFINDATLVARIESEAFRGMDEDPKAYVNLNSVGGVVFVRGEVPTPDMINEIERRVRRTRGVKDVENLMHLPGTPAPTAP